MMYMGRDYSITILEKMTLSIMTLCGTIENYSAVCKPLFNTVE